MSPNTDWYQEQRSAIEACCQDLISEGVIEPLAEEEGGETRSWNLCELASLVEGHFHLQLDAGGLSEEERLTYERRANDSRPLASPHGEYRLPFWLLVDGRRVGTIAVGTMYTGLDLVSISSLYVHPAERRRSIGRHALEAVFRAAVTHGAGGIRLDTHWTWQPAVRFYARIGMWVWMWKHDLVFTWQPELPPYRVEIDGAEARFLIQQEGQWRVAVAARNLGDRLGWENNALSHQPRSISRSIPGTFAIHLALAGWPLVRSEETWARRYDWSDAGDPEGLAHKIEVFEAVARKRGFDVRTPRIPGLRYRSLEEID